MENKIVIHTDGGARGNPGPAAAGYVIESINPSWKKEHGEYIGKTTNNVAEYTAVISALKRASKLLGEEAINTEVELRADSELLCKQIRGEYRVKNPGLKPLFMEVSELIKRFKSVTFIHVRREKNKEADAMVNIALDKELK